MQLQLNNAGGNVVQAADVGWVRIDGTDLRKSLLVSQDRLQKNWDVTSVTELGETQAQQLLEFQPELVIVGTGAQLVFPDRTFLLPFLQNGIGCEVMDTLAACRTYNVLLGEGRAVLAALILSG